MGKTNLFGKEYELIEHDNIELTAGMDEDNNIVAFGDIEYTIEKMKQFAKEKGLKKPYKIRFQNFSIEYNFKSAYGWVLGDIYLLSEDDKIIRIEKVTFEDRWF